MIDKTMRRFFHAVKIDSEKKITFSFDGDFYTAYEGDTLASALLAVGLSKTGYKPHSGRAMGILGVHSQADSSLIEVQKGDEFIRLSPCDVKVYDGLVCRSVRKTSLTASLFSISSLWKKKNDKLWDKEAVFALCLWDTILNSFHSLEQKHLSHIHDSLISKKELRADVLVIGAGASGLLSAFFLLQSGVQVVLCDYQSSFLQWLSADLINEQTVVTDIFQDIEQFVLSHPLCTVLTNTAVFSTDASEGILAVQHDTEWTPLSNRSPELNCFVIRCHDVIVATGCGEAVPLFINNDLPAIMLSSAVKQYITDYGVFPFQYPVIVTNNDSAYETAFLLHKCGIMPRVIIDTRSEESYFTQQALNRGIDVLLGHKIFTAEGKDSVEYVEAVPASWMGDAETLPQKKLFPCDAIVVSGGWIPRIDLAENNDSIELHHRYPVLYWKETDHIYPVGSVSSITGLSDIFQQCYETVKAILEKRGVNFDFDVQNPFADLKGYNHQIYPEEPSLCLSEQTERIYPLIGMDIHQEAIVYAMREIPLRALSSFSDYFDWSFDSFEISARLYPLMRILHFELKQDFRMIWRGWDKTNPLLVYQNTLNKALEQTSLKTYRQSPLFESRPPVDWEKARYKGGWPVFETHPLALKMAQEKRHETHSLQSVEALSLKQQGGIVDLTPYLVLEIVGYDAPKLLSALTHTHSVVFEQMREGEIKNALFLSADGHVLSNGFIARCDAFTWRVLTNLEGDLSDYLRDIIRHNSLVNLTWTTTYEAWSRFQFIGKSAIHLLIQVLTRGEENRPPEGYGLFHLKAIPVHVFSHVHEEDEFVDILIPSGYAKSFWDFMIDPERANRLWPMGTNAYRLWQMKSCLLPQDEWKQNFSAHHIVWHEKAESKENKYLVFVELMPLKPTKTMPSVDLETIDKKKVGTVLEWIIDPLTSNLIAIALCSFEALSKDIYVKILPKQDLYKIKLRKLALLHEETIHSDTEYSDYHIPQDEDFYV